MRKLAISIVLFALAACSDATVLGGDAYFVWVREPYLGSGDADEVAAKHCALFGKKAVFERRFELQHGKVREVQSYLCQ